MVGVVTNASESQDWSRNTNDTGVVRTQEIRGMDMTWFFASFNWATLSFLGLVNGTVLEPFLNDANAGLPFTIDQGLLGNANPKDSNPVAIACAWYKAIMIGAKGILAKGYVPYKGGSRIEFPKLLSTFWEAYPNTYIPYLSFWLADQGSWLSKFNEILPHPWYEFFVTTAPNGAYGSPNRGSSIGDVGTFFTMDSLPSAPEVSPTIVARVNPIPVLVAFTNGVKVPGNHQDRF